MKRGPQWIFTLPCDCPIGVMEGYEAKDPEDAMGELFYEDEKLKLAQERGVTARLIPWEEYDRTFYEKMKTTYTCPHGNQS